MAGQAFLHLFLLGSSIASSLGAPGNVKDVDVRKLSIEEKRRIIAEAKKQGPDGIEDKLDVLLEIYAADLFSREAHDNSMEIGDLVGKHPTLFPSRLIRELQAGERSTPLRLLIGRAFDLLRLGYR